MTRSSARSAVPPPLEPLPFGAWRSPAGAPPIVRPLLLTTPVDAGRQQEARDLVITDLGAERVAAIEREARDRGFAAGEREGREAARVRADALAARMAQTIDAIAALRTGLLRRSEQDVVRLAIAIAERIIHREVQLDREVILVAARAAIARLGAAAVVTVHVNPDDLAAMAPRLEIQGANGPIRLEADAAVPPGGCVVASTLGDVDATIEAQIQELRAALLTDDARRAGDTHE
jgi:flagellar assembly protein FliH